MNAHTHRHLAKQGHAHLGLVDGDHDNQRIATGNTSGPASYATGGFVVDLTAKFSELDFLKLSISTVGANLPPSHYEIALNTPTDGKATVKVMRHRYDRLSTVDNVSGQPAGVTVQAASGAATAATDPAVTTTGSAATVDAGAGTGEAQNAAHTHSHSHVDNNIYEHQHAVTRAETNAASVEITAATDLSGSTWRYLAIGTAA